MTEKQYSGWLAPIKRWLDGVTEKDLIKGAAIVTITGVFAGGAAYVSAGRIELPVTGMGGTIQAVSAVGAVIMTLLGWVLSSLIYHSVAHLLGGKGDRNRMFALAGYASVPSLVQQALRFADYWLLGGTPLSTTSIPELLLDRFNVFALAGLLLVGVAIMVNYGISGRRASLVALIPTFITLLLGLYSLRMVSAASTANQSGGLFSFRRG